MAKQKEKPTKEEKASEKFIFTSEKIEEVKKKVDNGLKITRYEKYWTGENILTKRDGIIFELSEDETNEYIKCKMGIDINDEPYIDEDTQTLKMSGIQYFAQTYCKIKNELGMVKNIKLRDYQEEILDMFNNNGRCVLMSSRQSGKCIHALSEVETEFGVFKIYKMWYYSLADRDKTIYDRLRFNIYRIIDKLTCITA